MLASSFCRIPILLHPVLRAATAAAAAAAAAAAYNDDHHASAKGCFSSLVRT